jgi:hypothetical protein
VRVARTARCQHQQRCQRNSCNFKRYFHACRYNLR